MNEIDARQRQDIWKLVNRLGKMRFHLTCLAQGTHQGANAGVFHWARVHEIYMDITVYAFRYQRSLQLPPATIDRDPSYVASLQKCIVSHMHRQEVDLFEQMRDLISLLHDEIQFRKPERGSDATHVITWLYCQKLDNLLTYMDIGVLKKVRATGRLQLRCTAESDAGRLLRARLPQDGTEGEIFLWDKPAGTWHMNTGISSGGALLICIEDLLENITTLPHWSELRSHVPLESSAHTSFATGKEQDT